MLPRAAVKEMVAKTQFAITGEDTRYFLNGALFILGTTSMTPGRDRWAPARARERRSAERGRKPSKDGEEVRAILPRKTLWELGKLLTEGEGDIRYERGENHLFFEIGGRMLISRMIDGQFPAFERVIPKGNNKRIEFERERLTNAVKRVALLSNERSRAVKFQLDKGKVEVTSSSPEFGEAKETLPVDYSDASMQICFNAQYVMDFLGAVDTDMRRARVEGRSEPGGDEADRHRRLRLHLRDHADEGVTG